MTTVPDIPRFDDFVWELVNMNDGSFTILDPADLWSVNIWARPGVTTKHRIESGYIEGPAGLEGVPSVLYEAMSFTG